MGRLELLLSGQASAGQVMCFCGLRLAVGGHPSPGLEPGHRTAQLRVPAWPLTSRVTLDKLLLVSVSVSFSYPQFSFLTETWDDSTWHVKLGVATA